MNERIRLLADKAAKYSAVMALPTGQSGNELFVEKFAELIVRECCDQVRMVDAMEIKRHFGVEE
jgi:hypothetical protein